MIESDYSIEDLSFFIKNYNIDINFKSPYGRDILNYYCLNKDLYNNLQFLIKFLNEFDDKIKYKEIDDRGNTFYFYLFKRFNRHDNRVKNNKELDNIFFYLIDYLFYKKNLDIKYENKERENIFYFFFTNKQKGIKDLPYTTYYLLDYDILNKFKKLLKNNYHQNNHFIKNYYYNLYLNFNRYNNNDQVKLLIFHEYFQFISYYYKNNFYYTIVDGFFFYPNSNTKDKSDFRKFLFNSVIKISKHDYEFLLNLNKLNFDIVINY
jgi:hypothetical protein